MIKHLESKATALRIGGLALLLLGAPVACDTNVSNPGPVQDQFLDDRNAAAAMVSGAGRALSQSINWIGYTGAAVAREIHPAGSTGSFGISNRWQTGELGADDSDLDTHWSEGQRARWIAEEALRRLEKAGPPPAGSLQTPAQYYNALQLAYVYAGFANRVLGENMCDAVIDGSAKLDNAVYFQRAESLFTKAIAVTGGTASTMATQATAAYAGRAQARLYLKKYAEAAADAGQVGITFVYNMPYYSVGDDNQRNRIAWAIGNSPYRAHTEWDTWYYNYNQATNDPRVPITITTLQGDAAISCASVVNGACVTGKVPFYPEAKESNSASPIRLASGREMRLIEAEVKLRGNDVTGAVTSINLVRTNAGVSSMVSASNATDAWTALKRERGIELWLEARRLGDLRRWKAEGTPGALDPLEQVGDASHLLRQDLCFPIPPGERQTNPNVR
jgi:hypothetical protein